MRNYLFDQQKCRLAEQRVRAQKDATSIDYFDHKLFTVRAAST